MERKLMNDLIQWKKRANRKPLIIRGARQVGKTWLVRDFGRKYFEDTVYIDFLSERRLHDIFVRTLDPARIIEALTAITGKPIVPEKTLIIFDELQEEPEALTSLKYFCEEASEYAVIATGSYMGIAMHHGTSFPVGKVDMLTLYPMNFGEFLIAVQGEGIKGILREGDPELITPMRELLIDLLRSYYVVGGMPEVVNEYVNNRNYSTVREIQERILDYYEMDFSKHADPGLVVRLHKVFGSIPSQLAKENRKFIFSYIAKGARAKDYELALMWLNDCGLIHIVHRVTKPGIPLKAYEDMSAFKIYMNDVGLLGAAGDLDPAVVVSGTELFSEFKGAISEQFVLGEMLSEFDIIPDYYSTNNSTGEIDFLFTNDDTLVPVEVKAEENLRARSLRAFKEKHPSSNAIRVSMSDYREESWLTNLPLYFFAPLLKKLCHPSGTK